jgi:hypothetical protein
MPAQLILTPEEFDLVREALKEPPPLSRHQRGRNRLPDLPMPRPPPDFDIWLSVMNKINAVRPRRSNSEVDDA